MFLFNMMLIVQKTVRDFPRIVLKELGMLCQIAFYTLLKIGVNR